MCRSLFVLILSNTVWILSLVLQISCFCLFMWPLSVAGAESGRYFWTDRAVKPGHVENCLVLISFSSVCFGGMNASWCRYFMSAAFDVTENALYAMFLVLLVYFLVIWRCILVMATYTTLFEVLCLPYILVCYYNTHCIFFHHILLCTLCCIKC